MAGLELSVDASSAIQSLKALKAEMGTTATEAAKTTTQIDKVGQTLDNVGKKIDGGGGGGGSRVPGAPASGGASGTGLAARISGVTGAMSGLRSVAGATSFSALSFEIGKLYDDFQGLKAGLGGSATGFTALKAVMKAHPILTIASIVSAATMAFSYLSGAIGSTADKYGELAQAMRKARLDEQAAAAFGLSTASAKEAQMQSIVSGYTSLLGNGDFNVASLSSATGRSPQDVAEFMWNQTRDPRYLDFLMGQEFGTGRFTESNVRGRTEVMTRNPAELKMTQQQAAMFSRQTYESIGATIDYGYGAGAGKSPAESIGMPYESAINAAIGSGVSNAAVITAQVQAQSEAAMRNMEQLKQLGADFGASLGDAFYQVAAGTASARQAMAALIADFARMGMRQAFSGLGSSVFGGFAPSGPQMQGPPTAAGVGP